MEVQRQWCSLEAIFIGSDDIREQLPEDAKRFDSVDSAFKDQMADASLTPNPLEACLRDGRNEEFEKCLAALELCQVQPHAGAMPPLRAPHSIGLARRLVRRPSPAAFARRLPRDQA